MNSFAFICLSIGVATTLASAETIFSVEPKVSDNNLNVIVQSDTYQVECNVSEKDALPETVLSIQSNNEAAVEFPPKTKSPVNTGHFNFSNYSHKTETVEGVEKVYFGFSFVPLTKGKLTLICNGENKIYTVVEAERTMGSKSASVVFAIPKSVIDEIDGEDKELTILGTGKGSDNWEASTNCSKKSDTEFVYACLNLESKDFAAGRYVFQLKAGDILITTAFLDKNSEEVKITGCKAATGSNCIAESPSCKFECSISGHPLLTCEVKGPTDKKIISTCQPNQHKLNFEIKEPTEEDGGEYVITVKGGSSGKESTYVHLVRVKDKLAPLWPFLGICAEVIILCGVILFFEKRHQNKQQKEQDTDARDPMLNQQGRGDVRQRPVKA